MTRSGERARQTPRLSEAELVTGVARGETSATEELFTRYGPDVNRVVWKLLGADPEHDDLVHDVFVAALAQIMAGARPEQLGGWVLGIAMHRVRRELRKRGVRRRFLELVEPFTPRSVRPDVEGPDLLRRIYGLLDRVAPEDRLAFCLRFLDRRSLAETAAACGCSVATAKRRIARARARLVQLAAPFPELRELLDAAISRRSRRQSSKRVGGSSITSISTGRRRRAAAACAWSRRTTRRRSWRPARRRRDRSGMRATSKTAGSPGRPRGVSRSV